MSKRAWWILGAAVAFVAFRVWTANKAGVAIAAAFVHPLSGPEELYQLNLGKDQGKYTLGVSGGLHPTEVPVGQAFSPAAYHPV